MSGKPYATRDNQGRYLRPGDAGFDWAKYRPGLWKLQCLVARHNSPAVKEALELLLVAAGLEVSEDDQAPDDTQDLTPADLDFEGRPATQDDTQGRTVPRAQPDDPFPEDLPNG